MIPAITPPTDNLYKFICLFGLTLFLFFSYNISFVHGSAAKCHMKVENIKVKAQRELIRLHHQCNIELNDSEQKFSKELFEIAAVKSELNQLQATIRATKTADRVFYKLSGELNKVAIELDALRQKFWLYLFFLSTGIVMILWGFIRWKRKDQNLRDAILQNEHEIKSLEKELKRLEHEKTTGTNQ